MTIQLRTKRRSLRAPRSCTPAEFEEKKFRYIKRGEAAKSRVSPAAGCRARSEPNESAIQNESGRARYEPNETAITKVYSSRWLLSKIQNEGARSAPESRLMKKKFSPKDVKKIRKIKMSFRPG